MKPPQKPRFREATYVTPDCMVIAERQFDDWMKRNFDGAVVMIKKERIEEATKMILHGSAAYFVFNDFELVSKEKLGTAEDILREIVANLYNWNNENLSCYDLDRQQYLLRVAKTHVEEKK